MTITIPTHLSDAELAAELQRIVGDWRKTKRALASVRSELRRRGRRRQQAALAAAATKPRPQGA